MKELTKFQTPKKNIGLYIHASSVKVNGKALLFLGHSSSGKTTISQLLSKKYPIIADDKVWIYQEKKGGWMVSSGEDVPSQGKLSISHIGRKETYPLLSILRIFKSSTPAIKPISPLETCRYLLDAIFEIETQKKQSDLVTIKKWFSLAVKISKEIPGWELTFKKNMGIIDLINEIFD